MEQPFEDLDQGKPTAIGQQPILCRPIFACPEQDDQQGDSAKSIQKHVAEFRDGNHPGIRPGGSNRLQEAENRLIRNGQRVGIEQVFQNAEKKPGGEGKENAQERQKALLALR